MFIIQFRQCDNFQCVLNFTRFVKVPTRDEADKTAYSDRILCFFATSDCSLRNSCIYKYVLQTHNTILQQLCDIKVIIITLLCRVQISRADEGKVTPFFNIYHLIQKTVFTYCNFPLVDFQYKIYGLHYLTSQFFTCTSNKRFVVNDRVVSIYKSIYLPY